MNGNPGQTLYTCVCDDTAFRSCECPGTFWEHGSQNRVRKLNDNVKPLEEEVIWRRKERGSRRVNKRPFKINQLSDVVIPLHK